MAGLIANLRDVLSLIVRYMGDGYLLIIYLVSLIYLFICEKEKSKRITLIYVPLLILLLIICPIYYRIYMRYLDDAGTYYRMLWLIPMTPTMAYAGCKAISAHRRIGGVIVAVLLLLCGRFTYTAVENKPVENAYHIPEYVITLCDQMPQDIPGVDVYACVPLEMIFYTRQYDTDICLLYGREAVEPKWGYYNEYFELYELADVLDWDTILEKTRDSSLGIGEVIYFVTEEERAAASDPEAYGLEEITRAGGYVLYKDPVAADNIREMLAGTPYLQ